MARLFDDASSQYLTAGSVPVTAPPFSISAWYNTNDNTINEKIIAIINASTSHYFDLFLRGDVAGDPIRFAAYNGVTAGTASTTSGFSTGVWQHACGVAYASNSRAVFLNGGSKGTNATDITPVGVDTINVAKFITAVTHYFSGAIAEIGIWNIALSDADVALLAGGKSPLCVQSDNLIFLLTCRTDSDLDSIGAIQFTAYGSPTITTHPPIIYCSSLTGALTSSGDLVKKAEKSLAGALTSSGSLAKKAQIPLAGALTSSGDIVKKAARSLAGSLASAGTVTKKARKGLSGILTSSGDLVKKSKKNLAGMLTSSATISRKVRKSLAGTFTSSGSIAKKSFVSLAGEFTSSGSITKKAKKVLSGVITFIGSLSNYWNVRATVTISDAAVNLATTAESILHNLTISDAAVNLATTTDSMGGS